MAWAMGEREPIRPAPDVEKIGGHNTYLPYFPAPYLKKNKEMGKVSPYLIIGIKIR
jgi:hypothetical protein